MLPRDPRRGSFFDLSDRTKLRLTGNDRIRFISGQITNDIRKASEASAIAACVLNAKGRLNAFVFVSTAGDSLFIDADAALNDLLRARLERYIIADDVQVEDVSANYALFHLIGQPPPDLSARIVSADRFAMPGFDIFVDAFRHDDVVARLSAVSTNCDVECGEIFRIEQGIPVWGAELTEEIIPVEANLEERSIDYEKGCYIGQEVISRMKMSGQRNKSLCGLIASADVALASGMKLYPSEGEKEAGWITSAIQSDRLGKWIGLGYVKRPFNQLSMKLQARDEANTAADTVPVEVVDLPFKSGRPES